MGGRHPLVKNNVASPTYSLEKKMLNKGKEVIHDSRTIGIVEVIIKGFSRGGLSNNSHKRHLRIVMVIESKKVKPDD